MATSGSELPLLGSNQESPDPMPLRLSPPLVRRAFVVWTVPSPSPLRGQVAPTQSLHLPHRGLARRCQLRVRRLREHSHVPLPTRCPASGPSGPARVRRVASYTKGQRRSSLNRASLGDSHFSAGVRRRQRGYEQ